jgi:hypothetical protein
MKKYISFEANKKKFKARPLVLIITEITKDNTESARGKLEQ